VERPQSGDWRISSRAYQTSSVLRKKKKGEKIKRNDAPKKKRIGSFTARETRKLGGNQRLLRKNPV